jgi:hypothetical protein
MTLNLVCGFHTDGQSAYIRLNKQLKHAAAEVRKGVELYNGVLGMCVSKTVLPSSITVQQVFDRSAFSSFNGSSPVCRLHICLHSSHYALCLICV